MQQNQRLRIAYRQRPQDHLIQHGKNGGVRADSESQRQHSGSREQRAAPERAHSKGKLFPHKRQELDVENGKTAYRYLPRIAFQRTRNGSRNACMPRVMLTVVPATSFQRTGISRIRYPRCRAIYSTSTSKPKPQSCCRENTCCAAAFSNSLKPHCVSWNGSPVMI